MVLDDLHLHWIVQSNNQGLGNGMEPLIILSVLKITKELLAIGIL